MTSKEKAKELVEKYSSLDIEIGGQHDGYLTMCLFDCKKCALIAVDEILENGNLMPQLKRHRGNVPPIVIHLEYWQEVKQEIEKL